MFKIMCGVWKGEAGAGAGAGGFGGEGGTQEISSPEPGAGGGGGGDLGCGDGAGEGGELQEDGGLREGGGLWEEGIALLSKALALIPGEHTILGALRDVLAIEERADDEMQREESARARQAAAALVASGGAFPKEVAAEGGGGEFKYMRKKWSARFEWVESAYAEALFQRPDDAAVLWGFAQLLSGPGLTVDNSPARRLINIRRSHEALTKALTLCPQNAKIHLEYARVQCEFKKDYELAQKHFLEAAHALPGAAEVWLELAKLEHYHLREYPAAEAYYLKCLSADALKVEGLLHYGLLLCNALQRYGSAKKLLTRALQLDPHGPAANEARLGLSYVELYEMVPNLPKPIPKPIPN
jgi:tetratricopeptide (TPR) repeat protein